MSKTKKFLAFFSSFILVFSTLSTTGAIQAIATENPIIVEDLPIAEDLIEVELPGLDD
ncbi:hypothetical protein [Fervidibacillus albus]|uniref:Uncharacterized protein n=1 Tax=Fervidibacillus albus TaxID=2980026 RepID=A0A9E8LT65_9BACI|nr:hypothetical protein [Fervidibacillus albus]WAA09158.1 hypothetical protein OE104_11270 [Fervidibacillus albus]